MPTVKSDTGLHLTTLRLWPETKSRVGCLTDWAPRHPHLLRFLNIVKNIVTIHFLSPQLVSQDSEAALIRVGTELTGRLISKFPPLSDAMLTTGFLGETFYQVQLSYIPTYLSFQAIGYWMLANAFYYLTFSLIWNGLNHNNIYSNVNSQMVRMV